MKTIEKTANTAEDAIDDALIELGLSIDEVDIEIVGRDTESYNEDLAEITVRVTQKKVDESAEKIKEFVQILLNKMEIKGAASISISDDTYNVEIDGPDMGLLIGRKGETLEALQIIVQSFASRLFTERKRVVVDIERYKDKRRQKLEELAGNIAGKVASSKRSMALKPMPASERRYIHLALQDSSDVTTASEGEGSYRHVVIVPKNK